MTEQKRITDWWVENRPFFLNEILSDHSGFTDRSELIGLLSDIRHRLETGLDEGLSGGYFLDLEDDGPELAGRLAPAYEEMALMAEKEEALNKQRGEK